MDTKGKHENYEVLNLIGYGLAKFDNRFIEFFGFKTKTDFYKYIVQIDIAETVGTVKNRQDLFDPFFENNRKGWWQKGDSYIHRKIFIDSLFGSLDANAYADIVKLYIKNNSISDKLVSEELSISPIIKSKFKQLQLTGQEAETFFIANYEKIDSFASGVLEDARMFGDGYDFQIEVKNHFFLTEVKWLRTNYGSIRMTKNEFNKAQEYTDDYALIVISNLDEHPNMNVIFNPVTHINLTPKTITSTQLNYHSDSISWKNLS